MAASDELTTDNQQLATDDKDLEYFQRRVRELDRQKSSRLTWKDMFRRREMPKFNYQPRFATSDQLSVASGQYATQASDGDSQLITDHRQLPPDFRRRGIKIKRRFGNDDPDDNTLKPIPAGRIMLYALLVTLLLYWIIN